MGRTFALESMFGRLFHTSHRSHPWYAAEDRSFLYKALDDSSYLRYSSLLGSTSNRSFSDPVLVSGQFCRAHHASVTVDDLSDMVKIHSTAPVFRPTSSRLSFWIIYRPSPISCCGTVLW